MGEVFKAHDPALNRMVAVKTIASSLGTQSELQRRFLREAQSAARLNHPNIITVFELGEDQDVIYMAMELLEGSDLKDLIGTAGLPDLASKLDVMEQVCEGLAFAHSMEVVHRDLKPGNVHVQPDGRVKILDFGLARLGASEMTRTGMVMGTPHYMSPEQVRGEKADARSDVFALGATFYELLAGRKAFDGDTMHAVLFQVLEQEPAPLRGQVEMPPVLAELIEKAMQKDAAARFHDASQMLGAVRAVRRALAEGRGDSTLDAAPLAAVPRVTGSAALQPQPRPDRPAPATLSAKAPTQLDARAPRARPSREPSPSRAPLYIGAALAVVALFLAGGFVALLLLGRPAPASGPEAVRPNDALTRVLVATQVEQARNRLDEKSYAAAISQAEQALKLDPANQEAMQVLGRARDAVARLDAAARETRAALASGDTAAAARGLWAILTIDPRYGGAGTLLEPLNPAFRDEAAQAKQLMAEARAAAERVKAEGLPAFATAVTSGGEGDALAARQQHAAAAARFLSARDDFDRARKTVQR